MPRGPIGEAGPGGRFREGRLGHRPRALLAGRPAQRLRVRVRLGARAAGSPELGLELRSVRRPDPRHRGGHLGGRLVASSAPVAVGRRVARFRIAGLDPAPGPHRIVVRDGERLIAARRIRVLPQSREPEVANAADERRPLSANRSPLSPKPLAGAAGELNHDLSFAPGSEAGASIAVETDDPSRGIAASGDGPSRPIAFITNGGFAAGSNAARTLPPTSTLPGGGSASLAIRGEPATAADAGGNLWMAAASATGAGRVVVNRVAAGSTTFRATTTALPRASGSSSQVQPSVAVADSDRIAVAWIETLGGVQNVAMSGCDLSAGANGCDDPDAWSPPVAVTSAGGLYSMPSLDFAPNGDLYVVWWDAGPLPGGNRISINRCRDGEDCGAGVSWDEQSSIASLDAHDDDGFGGLEPLPLFCPIIGAPGGLVNPSPAVEVGPGGEVYVVWSDLRDNADPGNPTRCTASGSDKTFDVFLAAGPTPDAIPTPESGARLSADGVLDLNDHFLPALSVDPSTGVIEASFHSTSDDQGGQRASRDYVSSIDAGASFSDPVELSNADSRFTGPLSDGFDYGGRQGGDSAAGTYRPAWTDNRPLQGRDADLYVLSPPVQTAITAAPSGKAASPISAVSFSTQAPRAICRVGDGGYTGCTSPRQVGPLGNGPTFFRVTSTDRAGNWMDLSPVLASWNVADLDPPETRLITEPKRRTKAKRPLYEFDSDEPWAKFRCRYDKDVWRICQSPKAQKVPIGRHKVRIRAFDLAGNVDPSPVKDTFRRIKRCGKRKKKLGKC